jgi:phage terminase large subunit-like protein
MRSQLRPNAFLRMIENRFVSSESTFVDLSWWDACVDPAARPIVADKQLPVWVGVDASLKRDQTAIVAVAWDGKAKQVHVAWHRVFQPSPTDPLDFERTIEATLLDLSTRFAVRGVFFDPWQMASVAQRLARAGLLMREYPQTVSNLTAIGNNLYELIRGRSLVTYSDADMRLAISRAIGIETPRGFRIAKEKTSHKIDTVVALAMAALAAVREGDGSGPDRWIEYMRVQAIAAHSPQTSVEPKANNRPWRTTQESVASTEAAGNELMEEYLKIRLGVEGVNITTCAACGHAIGNSRTTTGFESFCSPRCLMAFHKGVHT